MTMQTLLYSLILIFLTSILTYTQAQFYPHHDSINYLENFRGQFHFSPKSEWMNDINGLVYQGGKYHMIYQWGEAIRHGGYATSPDLLHWIDEGVALIPQKSFLPPEAVRNVSGDQVYSGSALVVSGNIAKGVTGSTDEAMIAVYTGTAKGTCLAWSNDGGKSWHDYIKNPVANQTEKAYPRDPCVIWHEATSKYVLALYENGTTFYGSTDLIHWDYLSNVKFGFECPDLFQLPVDEDENNKSGYSRMQTVLTWLGNLMVQLLKRIQSRIPLLWMSDRTFMQPKPFQWEICPKVTGGSFRLPGWIIGMEGLEKPSGKGTQLFLLFWD
jgi:sucrose-6-phosphate hydrolase SacC (GH32 family)